MSSVRPSVDPRRDTNPLKEKPLPDKNRPTSRVSGLTVAGSSAQCAAHYSRSRRNAVIGINGCRGTGEEPSIGALQRTPPAWNESSCSCCRRRRRQRESERRSLHASCSSSPWTPLAARRSPLSGSLQLKEKKLRLSALTERKSSAAVTSDPQSWT
ncbi:uncharacterized protein V6R79_023036 [Siganus canaliculatus]